jgi:SAM-dependent methyltransferase
MADATEYGRWIASEYDAIYGEAFDTDGAVKRLIELAGGKPVLEFGAGSGRLALPLARAGLDVHGVDASQEMLDLLRDRSAGVPIATTLADFTDVRVGNGSEFGLVLLAVNTIYAVPDQNAQVAIFETAAWHLHAGGRFVVEAWIPNTRTLDLSLQPRTLSPGFVGLVVSEHDPVTQTLSTTQIVLGHDKVRVFPVVHRYAWPSELDLMARLAGFRLEERWADWAGTELDGAATNHVSIYQLD